MPGLSIEFLATEGPDSTTSGLSRTVFELARALAARGHRVRVLYPADTPESPPPQAGVDAVPVPVTGATRRPFGRDIAIGRNASALLDPAADVVVGNDEKAGALEVPPGHQPGRPVFVLFLHDIALHTFDTLRPLEPPGGVRQRVGNWLDRRALKSLEGRAIRRARLLVVASGLNRDLLERHYPGGGQRVKLLPLGVPDPLEVGTKEAARLALRIPVDVPVVAFLGRTPERQGLPVALEAFRRVRGFFPGARLLVAGSSVPTEPGVSSLGVVDEPTKARVYRAADVFLFPARYEGFGLAPREAMRYGVATIVSRHVPMDGARPKETVRVVASDDPGDYAAELAELLADPALRRAVGDAGRAYADGFSYPKMAEKFEGLVRPLLGGG